MSLAHPPEPPTLGDWHLPRPESCNQTLTSYISSGSFSRLQRAQLDRENAHFILAEAVIQTVNKLSFETRNGLREASGVHVRVLSILLVGTGRFHDDILTFQDMILPYRPAWLSLSPPPHTHTPTRIGILPSDQQLVFQCDEDDDDDNDDESAEFSEEEESLDSVSVAIESTCERLGLMERYVEMRPSLGEKRAYLGWRLEAAVHARCVHACGL